MDDVEFDGMIYENLNRYEVPYNANHWELMAKRIREEFSLQSELVRYKVAEVSLMFLVLLTFIQFFPGQISDDPYNNYQEVQQVANPTENNKTRKDNTTKTNTATLTEVNTEKSQAITQKTAPIKSDETSYIAANNSSSNNTSIASSKKGNIDNPYNLPPLTIENHTGTSYNNASAPASLMSVKTSEETHPVDQEGTVESNALNTDNLMESLALESSPMAALTYDEDDRLPNCVLCKQKLPLVYKIGMMASMDLNLIMTPYDEKFDENSYGQLTTGYTGGITFGIHHGRIGVNTGFVYASKNYTPKENIELSGSLLEGYRSEALKSSSAKYFKYST